jgi:phenylacetate-CoA ligase
MPAQVNEQRRFWDEPAMTMSPDELSQLQLGKLRNQLRYEIDRSDYYRERIAAAGLDPEGLESLEQLDAIALFRKDEHRRSQEASLSELGHPYGLHLCAGLDEVLCVNATSGTTGIPTFYTFTRKDLLTNSECTSRALWHAGVRPGDTVLHGFALSMFVGGLPLAAAIQHLGAKVLPVGAEGGTDRLLQFAELARPSHMILTPSFAEHLIEKCPSVLGREVGELGLRALICGGEPGAGDPAVRSKLEGAYGAKIYDVMGGAYGYMSVSCDHHCGMHVVSQDHACLELIDPESSRALPIEDGAVGTIAYTSLDWEAGPILRYDMRDVTQVFTGTCACGLPGFRLKIIGRADDMLIVKGINVYPAAVKNLVAEFFPRTTGEIRIVLHETGPKVTPPLHLEVEHGQDEKELADLKADIEARAHDVLRFSATVQMVAPGSLGRTATKSKLIERRPTE